MKKFVVTLIILLILAGIGFGFGYVPLRLEPGTTAVLFSKTSGWSSEPYEAGNFAWAWQLLVPTNATLYVFDETSREVRIESSSLLPSADLYAAYLADEPRMTQRFRGTVRYRISAPAIAQLAPLGLRPEEVDRWYDDMDARVTSLTMRIVAEAIETAQAELSAEALTALITREIASALPDLSLISVVVHELTLPDIELYRLGRSSYVAVQEARRAALVSAAQDLAVVQATRDQQFLTFERYGQILTEYPVLLEYLEIAAQNDADPLDLTSLEDLAPGP
jgi:hypothetical protein